MKTNKMLALTAGFGLAASMLAGATVKAPVTDSARKSAPVSTFHSSPRQPQVLMAREAEPGDDRGGNSGKGKKGGKDDGKGHRFAPVMAREAEPGDDRGGNSGKGHKGGKDDGRGHRFAEQFV